MRRLLVDKTTGNREIMILENFTNIYTMDNETLKKYTIAFDTAYNPDGEINTVLHFDSKDTRDEYFYAILTLKDENWINIIEDYTGGAR